MLKAIIFALCLISGSAHADLLNPAGPLSPMNPLSPFSPMNPGNSGRQKQQPDCTPQPAVSAASSPATQQGAVIDSKFVAFSVVILAWIALIAVSATRTTRKQH